MPPANNLSYRFAEWLPKRYLDAFANRLFVPPLDLLAGVRPDVMLFPNYIASPLVWTRRSIVVIYDLSFVYHPQYVDPANARFLRRVVKQAAANAGHVATISEHSRREIMECYGLPESKFSVVYPGVDRTRFQPLPPATRPHVAAKFGIDRPYVLFTGTLEPRKNILGLLHAYTRLPHDLREGHALVIAGGKGWLDGEISAGLAELERAGARVIRTGYVEDGDMPALFGGASVFVFPSFYEGFGIPPLEAMACGTPVIASRTSSLPEVVGDRRGAHRPARPRFDRCRPREGASRPGTARRALGGGTRASRALRLACGGHEASRDHPPRVARTSPLLPSGAVKRVLITGADGFVGRHLAIGARRPRHRDDRVDRRRPRRRRGRARGTGGPARRGRASRGHRLGRRAWVRRARGLGRQRDRHAERRARGRRGTRRRPGCWSCRRAEVYGADRRGRRPRRRGSARSLPPRRTGARRPPPRSPARAATLDVVVARPFPHTGPGPDARRFAIPSFAAPDRAHRGRPGAAGAQGRQPRRAPRLLRRALRRRRLCAAARAARRAARLQRRHRRGAQHGARARPAARAGYGRDRRRGRSVPAPASADIPLLVGSPRRLTRRPVGGRPARSTKHLRTC